MAPTLQRHHFRLVGPRGLVFLHAGFESTFSQSDRTGENRRLAALPARKALAETIGELAADATAQVTGNQARNGSRQAAHLRLHALRPVAK